jgi:hypothetical protein
MGAAHTWMIWATGNAENNHVAAGRKSRGDTVAGHRRALAMATQPLTGQIPGRLPERPERQTHQARTTLEHISSI